MIEKAVGQLRHPFPRLTLLLVAAYLGLGVAGLLLGAPSPVFPPAGLALAAVLWFGVRALPGVWLGAVVLNLSLNWLGDHWLGDRLDPALVALTVMIASGAALQAWAGARLVRRWQGAEWTRLEREPEAFRFLLLGGVLAGVVSASGGAGGLWAVGQIGSAEVLFTWWTWYVGDVIGILVFAPLALSLLNRADPLWRDRRRQILVPVLLSLGLAVLTFYGASEWERQGQRNALQQAGVAVVTDLGSRLLTHQELLSALGRFIEATPAFTQEQFEQFTRGIFPDHPDIFALSFSPLVPGPERRAFEERMDRPASPGRYQITEMDAQGRLIRAGERAQYAPIQAIVPLDRNAAVLGFDHLSEPVRRGAAERALADGGLAIAGPVRLAHTPWFPAMLGVLLVDDRVVQDAGGRPRPLGFVVAAVRLDTLIDIATQGKLPAGLLVELRDSQGDPTGALIYQSGAPGGTPVTVAPGATWSTTLRVGDRDWVLSVLATPTYLSAHRSWIAWAIGVAGLLFAGLLQVLMLGMTGRASLIKRKNEALESAERVLRDLNSSLERRVDERTAELVATRDEIVAAMARLQANERTMRRMLDNIPTAIAALSRDAEPRTIFLNEQFVRTFGYTLEEIPTLAEWGRRAHPDQDYRTASLAAWDQAVADAARGTGQVPSREIQVTGKDGRVREVEVSAVLLNDMLLVSLVDETERRHLEERLRVSEEHYRLLAENSSDFISVLDLQGRYTYVGPAVERLRGYTRAEVLQQTLEEVMTAEGAATVRAGLARCSAAIQGGLPVPEFRSDLEQRCRDGSTVWTEVSISPLHNGVGECVGMLAVSRDISQRKGYERALEQARQAAESANRAKSVFLANMSHEIRTPMTGIIGMSQLALRAGLDGRQRDYVQKIETLARSLLGILNDILDLSKIEAGQLGIECSPFDLRQLVEKVIHLVEIAAQEKGLQLRLDLAPDLSPCREGDALRITQILTNLLGNAVKFTAAGTVRLAIDEPAPGRLRLAVHDTGIGLGPREQERLFQPFAQADSSTTRRFGGTGLGLIITRQLAELMDGHIEVTSEPGQGSCFSVEIAAPACQMPIPSQVPAMVPDKAESDQTPSDQPPCDQARLAGRRILLVEDNPINREIVLGFLEGTGLTVAVARDGREAVERYRQGGFDLVLMDIQMPELDGYAATRQIRALDPGVPVIALTANVFEEDVARARAAGMNAHLGKPITASQLLEVLGRYLGPDPSALGPTPAGPGAGEPHLDPAAGLALMGGQEALYRRVLASFVDHYGGPLPTLDPQLEPNDPGLRRTLHSLKGLSGNIGAPRLRALAITLEQSEDPALLVAFREELAVVLGEVRSWLQAAPGQDAAPGDAARPGEVQELFGQLRLAAEARSSRRCREALDRLAAISLSGQALPGPQEALLRQASGLLDRRDYQALARLG